VRRSGALGRLSVSRPTAGCVAASEIIRYDAIHSMSAAWLR
jgi:hypothetical protein